MHLSDYFYWKKIKISFTYLKNIYILLHFAFISKTTIACEIVYCNMTVKIENVKKVLFEKLKITFALFFNLIYIFKWLFVSPFCRQWFYFFAMRSLLKKKWKITFITDNCHIEYVYIRNNINIYAQPDVTVCFKNQGTTKKAFATHTI